MKSYPDYIIPTYETATEFAFYDRDRRTLAQMRVREFCANLRDRVEAAAKEIVDKEWKIFESMLWLAAHTECGLSNRRYSHQAELLGIGETSPVDILLAYSESPFLFDPYGEQLASPGRFVIRNNLEGLVHCSQLPPSEVAKVIFVEEVGMAVDDASAVRFV